MINNGIKSNIFFKQIIDKYPVYLIILLFLIFLTMSFFRNPYPDERKFYLIETSHMASVLADGEWFGNDGVGAHGFLFKLPVALIFLVTGPSVFIATLFNIVLSILCCILFYKIIEKYFIEDHLRFIGLLLFSTSYYFIAFTPTYLREIPAILSLLLFLFLITNKKNKFFIGLSLLLLLDAKEHVFFQIVPGFIIWLIYYHFFKKKDKKFLLNFKTFIIDNFIYFTPPLVLLLLMFFTEFVPVNMIDAVILGLIKGGFNKLAKGFTGYGNSSLGLDLDYSGQKLIPLFNLLFSKLNINILEPNYFTKLFMPRLFSFTSIPKLVVIPVIITSFITLFKKDDEFKDDVVLFFFILWSFLVTLYLRDSNGRYLFSISPLIFFFFIKFLKEIKPNKKNIIIFSITVAVILFGFLFEYFYIKEKIILNLILILYLFFLLLNSKIEIFNTKIVILFFGILLSLFTLSTAIVASYKMRSGQINSTIKFGYCSEVYKIAEKIPDDTRVWINGKIEMDLLRFYKYDRMPDPEFNKELQDWIPKKRMLKKYNSLIYWFGYEDINDFKKQLLENKIEKIVFQYSLIPKLPFYKQKIIKKLKKQRFLKLLDVLDLKNKKVYIFDVNMKYEDL